MKALQTAKGKELQDAMKARDMAAIKRIQLERNQIKADLDKLG